MVSLVSVLSVMPPGFNPVGNINDEAKQGDHAAYRLAGNDGYNASYQ